MAEPEDRRKHPRFPSLNLVSYSCLDESGRTIREGMGKTLDVSEAGISLETHESLEDARLVSVAIGLRDDLADLRGEVVYFYSAQEGQYRCGIRFGQVDEAPLRILRSFVAAFRRDR